MKRLAPLLSIICLLGLAACDEPEPGTYPVSHETCSPDDPVKDLDPPDCAPHM